MRLIDADALGNHLNDIWLSNTPDERDGTWYKHDRQLAVCVGLEYAQEAVSEAQTVDAAPIVHSRWVEPVPGDGFPYCANCKKTALDKGLFLNPKLMGWHRTKYCPNCGALMDGKAE